MMVCPPPPPTGVVSSGLVALAGRPASPLTAPINTALTSSSPKLEESTCTRAPTPRWARPQTRFTQTKTCWPLRAMKAVARRSALCIRPGLLIASKASLLASPTRTRQPSACR